MFTYSTIVHKTQEQQKKLGEQEPTYYGYENDADLTDEIQALQERARGTNDSRSRSVSRGGGKSRAQSRNKTTSSSSSRPQMFVPWALQKQLVQEHQQQSEWNSNLNGSSSGLNSFSESQTARSLGGSNSGVLGGGAMTARDRNTAGKKKQVGGSKKKKAAGKDSDDIVLALPPSIAATIATLRGQPVIVENSEEQNGGGGFTRRGMVTTSGASPKPVNLRLPNLEQQPGRKQNETDRKNRGKKKGDPDYGAGRKKPQQSHDELPPQPPPLTLPTAGTHSSKHAVTEGIATVPIPGGGGSSSARPPLAPGAVQQQHQQQRGLGSAFLPRVGSGNQRFHKSFLQWNQRDLNESRWNNAEGLGLLPSSSKTSTVNNVSSTYNNGGYYTYQSSSSGNFQQLQNQQQSTTGSSSYSYY